MTAKSIFIVEDEIITAKSIAKNIKNLGYQVSGISTTGTNAIAQIVRLKPDLILMDILLKKDEIDGIITAQKVQEQVNIPIVYLTAHSDEETLERAKITAPFGYILKPYSKKDLQITIKMALYKHSKDVEIAERENLFSKILNSTKEGVIAADNNNEITYINPAAEELTGYTIKENLGKDAIETIKFLDTENNQSIPHPIQQVLEKGEVIYLNENVALIAKWGQKISIKDSVAPIFKQPTNQIEGAVLIFAPADRFLSLKTPEQSQPNLFLETSTIQTNLEQLSNNLFHLITHELRAPLAIILSTSESLRRYRQRWTVEKQNDSFNKIKKAVGQMIQLLEDIAVWKQTETKELFFKPEQVDLIDFCQEILSDLPVVECNHQLIFCPQLSERIAFIDTTLLRYILNNLLLNAVKYSPQHSVVSLTVNTQENGNLVFKVQDRGMGIPFKEQSYLFNLFYRGSNVGNIAGTGLGLTIVKMCVELHQGNIYIESEVNVGTTFSVVIPTSQKS